MMIPDDGSLSPLSTGKSYILSVVFNDAEMLGSVGFSKGAAGSLVDRNRHLFLICSCLAWEQELPINDRYQPRHKSRNEEIVAKLREQAGAGPPVDPAMKVKRLVAETAIAMALLHGGDWRVQFEPENGLVMIARRRRRPRRSL